MTSISEKLDSRFDFLFFNYLDDPLNFNQKLQSSFRPDVKRLKSLDELSSESIDLLVIDSYSLNVKDVIEFRKKHPHLFTVLIVDDASRDDWPVHLLIRWSPHVSSSSRTISGVVVSSDLLKLSSSESAGGSRGALLCLGGSSLVDETLRVIGQIKDLQLFSSLSVIVPAAPSRECTTNWLSKGDSTFSISIDVAPENFFERMSGADFCFLSCSNLALEAVALGKRFCAIQLADHQSELACWLIANRRACVIKFGDEISRDQIEQTQKIHPDIASFVTQQAQFIQALSHKIDHYFYDRYLTAEIEAEYDAASASEFEYQKVKWGSEASMQNRFQLCKQRVEWNSVSSWLDIGCGTGAFFNATNFQGRKVGLDLSDELLKTARSKNGDAAFLKRSFVDHIEGERFFLVTALGVLQKCGIPHDRAIALMSRWVAPGGLLMITTKNRDWKRFDEPGFKAESNHHWFHLTDLVESLELNFFDMVEMMSFDPAENRVGGPRDHHSLMVLARLKR